MKFRTEYKCEKALFSINPRRKVTLLGSCFAEKIGARMKKAMWDVCVNPCGALYNPVTVGQTVMLSFMTREEREKHIRPAMVERDEVWLSWHFDSTIHARSAEEYLEKANAALDELHDSLLDSGALIVTLGTAIVYRHKNGYNGIVANCHKFPAHEFDRELLNVDEICRWSDFYNEAVSHRLSHLNFVETISPVRHLGEGMHQNALSKATLQLATRHIVDNYPGMHYFPSYEIMLDDLRDYRFYASDMVHPSEEAADYIWEKFCETYLTEEGLRRVKEGEKLYRRLHHRPIIEGTRSDEEFRKETERLLEEWNQ